MEDPVIQIGKGVYNMSNTMNDELKEQIYEALYEELDREPTIEEMDSWPVREVE
jgi:hypothetical protein